MVIFGLSVALLSPVVAAPPPLPSFQVVAVPPALSTPAGNEKLKDEQALRVENMLVEISVGADMIWSGRMGVNRLMGARYSFKVENAAEKGCPDPVRGASAGRDLSVELGNSYYGSYGKPNEYRVSVNYFRSRPSASCKPANRALRLEETIYLLPGQETTLSGDGGFKVRIVRPSS